MLHNRIHGIDRGSRNIGNDGALRPGEAIEQRGFTDVRASNDGDIDLCGRSWLVPFLGIFFEIIGLGLCFYEWGVEFFCKGLEQRVETIAMFRRNRINVFRKLVKRRGQRFLHLGIDFVGQNCERLARAAQ